MVAGPSLRICLVYDCLFPYTVGGAERWYRNLATRLAAEGHEVTYLTRVQWEPGERPELPGVRIVALPPRIGLYTGSGRRRMDQAVLFGRGVLGHLLRHGRRYDVVHTAQFPFFSLLAAAAVRPVAGFRIVVDWHEVWTPAYWIEYLGPVLGRVGWAIQRLCARATERAFTFSRLHAERLRGEGMRGEIFIYGGSYGGPKEPRPGPEPREPTVVFAGRHIPEKRVGAIPPAMQRVRRDAPELRAVIYGDGPDRPGLLAAVEGDEAVDAPGFVSSEEIERGLASATVMVLPSRREGLGLVVIEAASFGTPSVVVADPDSASPELIEEGVNGTVAASTDPEELAAAILRVRAGGAALRRSTAAWFAVNGPRLHADAALALAAESYRAEAQTVAGLRPT